MNKLKICNKCKENKKGTFGGYWPYLNEDYNICKECGGKLETINFESDDFLTIRNISTESNFIEAMIDLHDKDIIEYELKMSQFRNQVEQQKSIQNIQQTANQNNAPKCPYCNSTNIKPIGTGERIGSIAMLGMFSKKINKSFKCLDCKYTW